MATRLEIDGRAQRKHRAETGRPAEGHQTMLALLEFFQQLPDRFAPIVSAGQGSAARCGLHLASLRFPLVGPAFAGHGLGTPAPL